MAKGYKQIKPSDNPKPFKKGNNANPNGRPRKLISDTLRELKEKGISVPSKDEIKDIYLSLMNLSIPDLEELSSDDEQSGLVRIVIKNILSGKGFDIIEKILDRGLGKPSQTIDANIKKAPEFIVFDAREEDK